MIKALGKLFFSIAVLFASCNERQNATEKSDQISVQADDLKVGGIYLLQNEDSTFYLSKILVIDDFAIHLRTYRDTFRTSPNDMNLQYLKVLIGHAPLDKRGFLKDKPKLIKVEEVKESELEGYKMYLEAMDN